MKQKVKKRTLTGKLAKTLSVAVIGLALVLMLNLADLFSSLITVGGFSFAGENVAFNTYNVYAVCTSSHPTKLAASELAETTQIQGGAGYILTNENAYFIVASIYETKADAEKVLENIIQDKPNASIQNISISSISLSSNLSAQEKSTISNSISIFKTAYKKLYDISVSLDTGIVQEVNARLSINEIASLVTTTYGNFNTIFANSINTSLMHVKLALESLLDDIQKLIDTSDRFPYTSRIKETYCKVIMHYKTLADGLKNN